MKQYDLYMGESGGKEDDLSKTINKGLDEAYNTGIDHAIEKVMQGCNAVGEMAHVGLILHTAQSRIITELLKLKKPTV